MFRYKKIATSSDIGDRYNVLWNPQGVRDFKEEAIYRTGEITHVYDDGGFRLDLGGAIMICCAYSHNNRQVNPFRNMIKA